MVDTERFRLGPELVERVTALAACAAVAGDGAVSPLQIATYMPIDVESICRILESVQADYDLERLERNGIRYFRFADPEAHAPTELGIEEGDHLRNLDAVENNYAALKSDEGWSRRVREQHTLLRLASRAGAGLLELEYFLDRSDMSDSRLQSLLNDFGAEGYVDHAFDRCEDESIEFRFPPLDYPEERFERNMRLLEQLGSSGDSPRVWAYIGASVVVLLVLIAALRFYAV